VFPPESARWNRSVVVDASSAMFSATALFRLVRSEYTLRLGFKAATPSVQTEGRELHIQVAIFSNECFRIVRLPAT